MAKLMYENKNLLVRYGGTHYRSVMGNMINQIEHLTDAQMDLENVFDYSQKYLRLVNKNIPKRKWRVALKWSTKVSDNCLLEEQKMHDRLRQLNNEA